MTAIVGPNGSGKSNLLDALRWVLGDSHASKLRVQKQGGLIFHGSASRPKGDEGEVGIQMRDGIKICTIRRKVTEQGGLVTVDGLRTTLTDLEDVKREWGLAGDQFAFIGQGEVSEVIQQRPTQRRMLLEALFGIDAYRKRRDAAADKLEEAKAEYEKLQMFYAAQSERREQIAPLVAKAEEARALLDAIEEDRRLFYWVRRARTSRASAEIADALSVSERDLAAKIFWRTAWERAIAEIESSIAGTSSARQAQIRELEQSRETLTGITKAAYGHGATLTAAKRRASQIAAEREAAASRVNELRAERDKLTSSSKERNDEIESTRIKLGELTEKFERERAAIEASRDERAKRLSEAGAIEGEMTALKSRTMAVAMTLKKIDEDQSKGAKKEDPARAIKKEMDELEKKHEAALDRQDAAASAHRDAMARLESAAAELQRARRESKSLDRRLAEVADQASADLYPRPVQHILSAAKLGKVKVKPCAVIDAFTCGEELASAMEAYLAGRQFWLLVDTMDEAGECIDLLKKNQMGRATFLPLERSRPRFPESGARLPKSGIVGWAMELIEPQKKWRPAIEHLMGDLLIVESYEVGQSLVRGGHRGPVATLDGDVFQPGGTVSGGKAQKQGRAIELKSALAKLEADAAAASALVEKLAEEFPRIEEEEAVASSKKDEAAAELRAIAERRSELDAARESALRDRDRAKRERDEMKSKLAEGAREYADLARRRRDLLAKAAASDETSADESIPTEIERLKSALAILEEKAHSSFVIEERISREMREQERSLNSLDEDASESDREIIESRASLTRLARRYAEVSSRRRVISAEMEEFRERYEKVAASREKRSARCDAARAAEAEARASDERSRSRASELERELAELIATWEEQYPYPGEGTFDDADPDALRRAIRERDRQVKALGDVDMGALSEDRSLRDQLAFLGGQLDDARGGMAELARLITDADEQARAVFSKALEEIDKKFNAMFKMLFTGGDAKLEMIEGASLWDSGVDVVARPPGKHPQSIATLSGGEQSLSAIALLFASLEVANCPIAVLDEVDAALDEVNLRRFADLAKEQSKERQIFVMTHRRVTMERADTLYGVTLAEPGLSQVIGVRVEDWA